MVPVLFRSYFFFGLSDSSVRQHSEIGDQHSPADSRLPCQFPPTSPPAIELVPQQVSGAISAGTNLEEDTDEDNGTAQTIES